ncbi:hypothetical protein F1642_04995 [Paracoccus sp. NBH48]|uniref:hypothetical protein n=1 Tax=Paracoccus sp. NBH48 TaxID=2596918 RepID=UPI00189183C9|nr:hypothetical protein [Paracoccus sp. NBH48]MBF5078521.1 hypothetical protein [Paracoccus sp. NBH48]
MNERVGSKIIAIHGIGTDLDDQNAFVDVTIQDGSRHSLVFDEDLANQLAMSFLAAGNHLLGKIAAREAGPTTTRIPGQPIPLSSGSASIVQYGPDKVVALNLTTDQGFTMTFTMSPRAADMFAKRLSNRRMAEQLQDKKRTLN